MRVLSTFAALALLAPAAVAGTVPYAAGSLILPPGSAYQDDCGAVSVYGLVYDILRANPWLSANGYTPITVNYAYDGAKSSPNRCAPTNLSTPPSPSTDPSWTDGCDVILTGGNPPVTLVTNSSASRATTDTNVVTFSTVGKTDVFPQYASQTISAGSGVTTVRYLGGPLIIAASDAATFTKLLDGTILATDTGGNTIDFSPFRTNKGSCTWGSSHYVYIHRAAVAFSAPAGKSFTSTPPRIALLATDRGRSSGSIFDGILEGYLKNAGLDFTGAQGCPTGGMNATVSSVCPRGGTPGQIFDLFDIQDLKNNLMSATSGGQPVYGMVWMPHWETTATGSAGPNPTETAALDNVSTFLNSPGGMMAECASIESIEGAYNHGGNGACGGLSNYTTCAPRSGPNQYQSCANNGSGACSASVTPWGFNRNTKGFGNSYTALKNCTDVTTAAGTTCMYLSAPGDPYAQIGDYMWNAPGHAVGTCYNSSFGSKPCYDGTGDVADFLPNSSTGSIYKPGVVPLISEVATLDRTKLSTPAAARAMIVGDVATRNIKDNAANHGNILYLAGHDLTGTVSGTKLALETLLQLGFDTTPSAGTTTEVSRATPILATISGQDSIVQGTFEYTSPAPTRTTVTLASDVPSFTFPYEAGHLRARVATTVSTSASTFTSGTILFDAANELPAVAYAGCGANAFTGRCRTVFTTTTVSGTGVTRNPGRVLVEDGNADTIGALIAPGLAHTQWVTLTERLLAGISDGSGGYKAELGGIDRSTVAVIGGSAYTGGSRAQMIYVGATDGMLHAFCGQVDAAHGCDVLGRELWAFMPRVQLPFVRLDTTRIDGSPHVADLFGDFTGSGTKSFRTILTFQTGSGDATTAGQTPAVYALDVTDPQNPTVIWEDTLPGTSGATTRGALALGSGETLAAANVLVGGSPEPVIYAETNNGGTGGAGVVLTAIHADTGAQLFQVGDAYPAPRTTGDSSVPATGIPGGAVGIDKTGQGYATDIVFADLYGDLWEVDPLTGHSRTGVASPLTTPLFSFSTDYHPIGAVPAIYSNGSTLFAIVSSGGYADPSDSTWGTATQEVVGVRLTLKGATPPVDETSGAPNVPFALSFGAGERGFAQATVVGTQLFVTTDTGDVNGSAYGTTTSATGHVYTVDLTSGTAGTTLAVQSGASSVANLGTTLYTSSGSAQQQLGAAASTTVGPNVGSQSIPRMVRQLWLRLQ